MIEKTKAAPHYVVDTVRTIPVQTLGLAMGAYTTTSVADLFSIADQTPNPSTVNTLAVAIGTFNFAASAINLKIAKERLSLRKRTEGVFNKRGFDSRVVRAGSKTWCGRQAVKIASEKTGHLDEFKAAIDEPGYKKKFSWLPHV